MSDTPFCPNCLCADCGKVRALSASLDVQPVVTGATTFGPQMHDRPDGSGMCGYIAADSGFCNKCGYLDSSKKAGDLPK